MNPFTIKNDAALTVKAHFVDDKGQPAGVDGDVTWTSSNASIATVTAHTDDSTLADIKALGPTGAVEITAIADARIGAGKRRVTSKLELNVVAGEATGGVILPVLPSHGPVRPDRPVDPGYGKPEGSHPDQGLPPSPGHPDQGLPGSGAHPDHDLPNAPVRPDQGLPGGGAHPDHDLPNAPARPDQGLPGQRPPTVGGGPVVPPTRPDNSLPGSQPEPGHPLPPHKPDEPPAKPKGGKKW